MMVAVGFQPTEKRNRNASVAERRLIPVNPC